MSLQDDLTSGYYATTARRGHAPSRDHYEACAAQLRRRLQRFFPADLTTPCIDLACGCGELLYLLERHGFSNTCGVDLCAEELDNAKRFVKSELILDDVVAFLRRRPDASAGFITALNLLEHLKKDALRDLLVEARRVLRPGGTLVAMVPNALSPFGASTRYWDLTHERAFVPNNFHQLAALAGFSSRVDFRECGPEPHGIKSGVRYLLWQALRGAVAGWYLIETASTRGGIYTMDMLVRLHKD
ncbi:MAG: class I SAM-dependent methyltransferase [Polyangiaceae bacterium]|nr:class I SAM-dependent methyltransferase [Polyangiaceae bacterium]